MSNSNCSVKGIEATSELITGRAGLTPFVKYMKNIGLLERLERDFSSIKKNKKGLDVGDFFQEMLCWIMDGTSRHISYFDTMKDDHGLAASIEMKPEDMGSSDAITRMCKKFMKCHEGLFRDILMDLFVERLRAENPSVIEFSLDSMVMDNDEAKVRHGVDVTYKKVKGYHPIQIVWNGMIVDGIFRRGNAASNEISKSLKMLSRIIAATRECLGDGVMIVIRLDSGYYDQRIADYLDAENVAFIMSGKMYGHVKEAVEGVTDDYWQIFSNSQNEWIITELGLRSKSWSNFYRAFYTQQLKDDTGQFLLDFARPSNVILTNIGKNKGVTAMLDEVEAAKWVLPERIIASHHGRGGDELPHRALKELGFEQLPFKQFGANLAVYHCMLLALALFEGYKRDVLIGMVKPTAYADSVRRVFIDVAGKIVKKARQYILKIYRETKVRLNFDLIWARCNAPPYCIT